MHTSPALLYKQTMLPGAEPTTPEKPALPLWQRMGLLGLGYFFCAWLGTFLSGAGGTLVSFWLPGGLLVSALLLNDTRDWPWLMVAVVPANAIFDVVHDPHPQLAVIAWFCAANLLQAATGAGLVRRFVADRPTLASLPEFFGLMFFAGVIGSAVGATIGALMLAHFQLAASLGATWRILWGGNAMAVLVLAPLLLAFRGFHWRAARKDFTVWRGLEFLLLLTGMAALLGYVLVLGGGVNSPKVPALVFVLWAGLRFGLRGVTPLIFFMALWTAFLTTHYLTGITEADKISGNYIFTLQIFLAVAALVGLAPAIVLGERDRTLAQLRDSEARYRHLSQAAFDGIAITENGRLVDANEQLHRMFGYEPDEMIGKEVMAMVAPESRTAVMEAIRTDQKATYAHQSLRKGGERFQVEVRARLLRLGDRTLRVTALRDITERKVAERALRESEEKFSKAFRASPQGLAVSELETGRFIEVNEGCCQLYGCAREEMLGRTSAELGLWQDPQDRARLVAQFKSAGRLRNVEVRVRTRAGSLKTVLLSAEPINLGGKTCLVSALHDLSDRIHAEQALRASEESLRATIENTPHVAVQWLDRQGRVTYWNRASENLYGWLTAEALGKTLEELIFTPEQGTAFIKVITNIAQTGKPFGPVEFAFRHRNGTTGVILSTVFEIHILSGEPQFVCMDVDLTRRKQAEELSRSQKNILEMIASGQPMSATLEALVRMIEAQSPDLLCSILLLDADGLHVRHGAAPSLPAEYIKAVDGTSIGPCVGSCGTAAFRREPVFVADIASDPLWADYKHLALPHGLRACWSTPIFDAQRQVLGTFAVYHRAPRLPDARHQELIDTATQTAAICINKHRTEAERERAVAGEQQARMEYTRQLIAAQEAERKRIAAELHDSIGQNLLLIKNLAHMARQARMPEPAAGQLTTVNDLAAQCIAEVRQISRDLHPYQLDHLGLKRALEAMLEHAAQASSVQFTSKFEPVDELFSADAALNLYRIVQESLNNILKHSRARRAEFRLERDIHEVQLQIEDDGAGFVPEDAGGKNGLGLRNITERVRMLGGQLKVDSVPGKGTRLAITIPIAEPPA